MRWWGGEVVRWRGSEAARWRGGRVVRRRGGRVVRWRGGGAAEFEFVKELVFEKNQNNSDFSYGAPK